MERKKFEKSFIATTQKSHCNIEKSSIATSKKTIATRRNKWKRTCKNNKGMGSALTLVHHLRAYQRKEEFTRPLATIVSLGSRIGG